MTTVDLNVCEYRKNQKMLFLASEYCGMVSELHVYSRHTDRTVKFVPIGFDDPKFDEDHWDGEAQYYKPTEFLPNVEYLVIYHQY